MEACVPFKYFWCEILVSPQMLDVSILESPEIENLARLKTLVWKGIPWKSQIGGEGNKWNPTLFLLSIHITVLVASKHD